MANDCKNCQNCEPLKKNFEYSQKNPRTHQEKNKAARLVPARPFIIPHKKNGTFFFKVEFPTGQSHRIPVKIFVVVIPKTRIGGPSSTNPSYCMTLSIWSTVNPSFGMTPTTLYSSQIHNTTLHNLHSAQFEILHMVSVYNISWYYLFA